MNTLNNDTLQILAQEEQKDFTQAYREGKLYELISNRAIDIERDSGGKVMKIYFTLGGPTVWLDFYCHPGYIITAANGCENGASGIPYADWDGIQAELEEL